MRFAWELGDGLQPQDLLALASGYLAKEYHDELDEDLKQIKGSMHMLGDGGADVDEDDRAKQEEL